MKCTSIEKESWSNKIKITIATQILKAQFHRCLHLKAKVERKGNRNDTEKKKEKKNKRRRKKENKKKKKRKEKICIKNN